MWYVTHSSRVRFFFSSSKNYVHFQSDLFVNEKGDWRDNTNRVENFFPLRSPGEDEAHGHVLCTSYLVIISVTELYYYCIIWLLLSRGWIIYYLIWRGRKKPLNTSRNWELLLEGREQSLGARWYWRILTSIKCHDAMPYRRHNARVTVFVPPGCIIN